MRHTAQVIKTVALALTMLGLAVLLLWFARPNYAEGDVPTPNVRPNIPISVRQATLDTCTIPKAVAHRGGTEAYTENSLLAYTNSWAWGLNEWETDIRWDVTGTPVLMHDATIDRTTNGTGSVSSITWTDLPTTTKIDGAGSQLLKNQTFEALAALAEQKGATLAIEPKVIPNAQQVTRVLDSIYSHNLEDRVLLDSFSSANLQPFKDDPSGRGATLTYGLVTSTAVTPEYAASIGPILNIAAEALNNGDVTTTGSVASYQAAGLKVYAWTVDTPAEWAPQRTWGIDRYVTNNPKEYRAWRDWVCTNDAWVGEY